MTEIIKQKFISQFQKITTQIYLPNKPQHICIATILSLASFLVIWIYQPWDTSEYHSTDKTLFLAGYGVVTGFSYWFSYAIPLLWIKRRIQRHSWNAFYEALAFLFFILVLSLSTLVYHHWYFEISTYPFSELCTWTLRVLQLGFFLFLLLLLWKKQKGKNQKALIQPEIEKPKSINIQGTNKNEHFEFQADSIVYLKSDKNYIELYYLNDSSEIEKALLRGTLVNMQNQLGENFIRIHNSYIVNQIFCSKLYTKNTVYYLQLALDGKPEIPVSRKYRDTLRNALEK